MDGHCPSCYILAPAFKNRCLAQLNFHSFTGRSPEEGKWIFDLFVSFAFVYSFFFFLSFILSNMGRFGGRKYEEHWLERVSRLLPNF